jgi:hypothetical protein
MVFSTPSERKASETTIVGLLGTALSVRFVPRCYKQDESRISSVVFSDGSEESRKFVENVNTEEENICEDRAA